MLTQAIGDLLPLAAGVALSPVPIIAVILMLGTPRARTNGPAFALGWVLGLLVVSAVVLAISSGADDPDSTASSGSNTFLVLGGAALVFGGLRRWRGRPGPDDAPEMPSWMATIDTFTAGKCFVLGAALSGVNPKNLILTAGAAASIAQAGLSGTDAAVAVGVFVVIASLTVVGPVVLYLVASERAAATLAPVKEYMATHNAAIMAVIFVLLGLKLLGSGLGGLAS